MRNLDENPISEQEQPQGQVEVVTAPGVDMDHENCAITALGKTLHQLVTEVQATRRYACIAWQHYAHARHIISILLAQPLGTLEVPLAAEDATSTWAVATDRRETPEGPHKAVYVLGLKEMQQALAEAQAKAQEEAAQRRRQAAEAQAAVERGTQMANLITLAG